MSAKQLAVFIVAAAAVVGGVYLITPGEQERSSLMLYCGAGIRPAAQDLIKTFDHEYGVAISPTYAGSGQLLGQISSLQRGDLYMPGAELYVDKAIEQDLAVAETKRTVAYFVPVILVQKGNPHDIRSLQDLTKDGLRLGFGDERACAIGKQTLKILEKNDIPFSALEGNVTYQSETVNTLGTHIQTGSVDAVIMWDANARNFTDSGEIVPIDRGKNVISTIPIVQLTSSRHPEDARKFIEFITSERGRDILREHQYTVTLQ